MNYFSQNLDYEFINSNILIEHVNEIESTKKQKDGNDDKMNKKLYLETKNVYKNKIPEYTAK